MNSIRAVFIYEWRRSLTVGRIAWWGIMAIFPVAMTILIRTIPGFDREMRPENRDTFWSLLLYLLIPCVCCALSVLLTSGPAVAAELEQRSWVYLATRPNGITWLLLGKYLVAVTWGVTAACTGATLAIIATNAESRLQIWITLIVLSFLSCVSYSAVYLLIGALFPRRAMVFSVLYTGVVEVILGFIPAMVNRLTVQYRLRSLLVQWAPTDNEIRKMPAFDYVFGSGASSVHCLWLIALTILFLAAAIVVAHRREFTTAAEGDV